MGGHRKHRGDLAAPELEADFKTIADFRRATGRPSGPCSVSSCCFAGGSTLRTRVASVDGTRIKAVNNKDRNSRGTRCKISSARPTSGWTTICGGWTRRYRGSGRAAARARKIWPRRSRRSAKRGRYGGCWRNSSGPARTKYAHDPDSRAMAAIRRSASATTSRSRSTRRKNDRRAGREPSGLWTWAY